MRGQMYYNRLDNSPTACSRLGRRRKGGANSFNDRWEGSLGRLVKSCPENDCAHISRVMGRCWSQLAPPPCCKARPTDQLRKSSFNGRCL